MKRTLTLRREPLADLTAADLTSVVGGVPATPACPHSHDCPTRLPWCQLGELTVARCAY